MKDAVRQALGIPEKNTAVVPVKFRPSVKEVLRAVAHGNISKYIREIVEADLRKRYRL